MEKPAAACYHLPGLFEFYELYRRFLPLYREHREYFYDWCDIGSIYGAPAGCIWGGGRISCGGAAAREVLALLREYGISGRLTFSNSLLRAEHLADPQCNALCEQFAKAGSVPEVNFPGLMGFVQYCAFNMGEDHVLYGGKLAVKVGTDQFLNWLDSVERAMLKAETDAGFYAPGPFKELVEKPKGVISLGAKMGEGWLLTAEMIELVQGGYGNIVCAQPFGCLPNHIVGKGMVNKIRALYPSANITPIDYDPSATRVNQENRIKLMLAVAKERLNAPVEAQPLTAEQLAGGAPQVGATV